MGETARPSPVRVLKALPDLPELLATANFRELRHCEVRLVPSPMDENFSGSCTVTSRNSLIHNGATTVTKSASFDAEGAPPCCCRVLTAVSERLLVTVNFREFQFHALR